jgi:15-cis-phytoene synthase
MAEPTPSGALPASIQKILAQSGSNLAFALAPLPVERRADMQRFYAFCRVVDDIVDEPGPTRAEREAGLLHWEEVLLGKRLPTSALEAQTLALMPRYGIPVEDLLGIIEGMRWDLDPPQLQTQQQLEAYCWRAACLVGLVSIRIFGCTERESVWYAEDLGMALQLTNILRDVGADAAMGRIYLPADLLARHGVSAADILAKTESPALTAALTELADLADDYFKRAKGHRTAEDRRKLLAAETMRRIYHRVLGKIRRDGFQVFRKHYRLSKIRKIGLLAAALAGK